MQMGYIIQEVVITCPTCQHKSGVIGFSHIHREGALQIYDKVLNDESFFFHTCPFCHGELYLDIPCLYIDDTRKSMIWLTSAVPNIDEQTKQFLGERKWTDYTCRIVKNAGELREKIIEMESPYDDRTYELLKMGAYRLLTPRRQEQYPLSACHISRDTDQRLLVFLDKQAKHTGCVYKISKRIEEMTQDLFEPIWITVQTKQEKGHFLRFDTAWANQMLEGAIQMAERSKGIYAQLLGYWIHCIGQEIFQCDITVAEK